MDLRIFFGVLTIGIGFVAVQGAFSFLDGRFSQEQLDRLGITDSWSFLQHGGMWADVFIISPIVAYALSKYRLDGHSLYGLGTFALSLAGTVIMVEMYRRMGKTMGDHCTHDGKTTIAGWIHAVYAFVAIWVCLEIYLGFTTPIVSKGDIVFFSVMLTPFFYLGVKKFSDAWIMSTQDKWQVAVMTTGVWMIAVIRLVHA